MNQKLLTVGFLLLSAALSMTGYFLKDSYELGICGASLFCQNLMTKGEALFSGGFALTLVFLVLLFVPKAFSAWKKFAIWAIPIMVLIFAFYKGSGGFDFVSPDPETFFKWLSGIYVVISLVIIFLTTLKAKSNNGRSLK